MTSEQYQKQAKHPERDVQAAICQYLTLNKIPYSITDATAVLNLQGKRVASKARRGWPDLTCVAGGGRAVFIEVKSSTGRVRPEQDAVHAELRKQGAIVIVARNIQDVEDGWPK